MTETNPINTAPTTSEAPETSEGTGNASVLDNEKLNDKMLNDAAPSSSSPQLDVPTITYPTPEWQKFGEHAWYPSDLS